MDESNLENLRKMAPEGTSQKIAMLLEQGVPDPWFTADFQETYQLVKTWLVKDYWMKLYKIFQIK